jgi:hypothetical protein
MLDVDFREAVKTKFAERGKGQVVRRIYLLRGWVNNVSKAALWDTLSLLGVETQYLEGRSNADARWVERVEF